METNIKHNDQSTDYRLLLKRALQRINDLEQAVDQANQRSHNQSIAIVGIGCRLPGGGNDPDSFWDFLREGNDAITEVPLNRWDLNAFYDSDPDIPNKTYSRHGAFLENIDLFDPEFFGIAPREALSMDPQQRLLLEVAWESLENAGQNPLGLAGSKTGIFIGIWSNDYSTLQITNHLPNLDMYFGSGNSNSIASGRISYVLGLRGPCISVDTACSSSLLAAHLACQSLRMGECDIALAGGVNLILSPHSTIIATKANMLSRDGHCKTFDASADGYVRGEGCGIVVMKRLSDATAHKDRIYAVIRGSATNHDGRSNGLSAPSARAQEEVIRSAVADASISPGQVHYIEAHGTGTNLGDPIEMQALGEVFDQSHSSYNPLFIGTVKTNIGHLEAAAGVTGLIKTALVLQHKEIPPHLHLKEPNPLISWDRHPFKIPMVLTPWPERKGKRMAGLSSFGFSGSNVHMILEEAPVLEVKEAEVERPLHLLALSTKNEKTLVQVAERYAHHLSTHAKDSLADVCFTANTGRAHFDHRLAMVVESSTQVQEQLGTFIRGETPRGIFSGQKRSTDRPAIAFLFTGQGSQYVGMGRELFDTQPTFRKTLERCDELLLPYLEQPLLQVLYPQAGQNSPLDQTAYTQPALFALEYALAGLWRSWGIKPSVVMGHSVGEYVAACVAGVFSLEDGLKLIAARARLMHALPAGGRMVAVLADEARVAEAIAPYGKTVSLACLNGPENMVISGAGPDVTAVLERFEAEGIGFTPLTVSHAFHSPLMEPMLEDFERVAAEVTYASPRMGLVSNVSGTLSPGEEMANGAYWRRHIRQPVRFSASMAWLRDQSYQIFMELGPHPVLLGMGAACLPDTVSLWLPSLKRGDKDWQRMLTSLIELYVRGADIDWAGFDLDYKRRRVVLPTYPFQRRRHWVPETMRRWGERDIPYPGSNPIVHPLLGARVRSPLIEEIVFTSTITADAVSFLKDHVVFGMVVFPATGYLEMALAAARLAFDSRSCVLEDVAIEEALILPDAQTRELQLVLTPPHENTTKFKIYSLSRNESDQKEIWSRHASGTIRLDGEEAAVPSLSPTGLDDLRKRCAGRLDTESYYQELRGQGIAYGEAFRSVEELWHADGEGLGRLRLADALIAESRDYHVHPALLDGCLQVLGAGLWADANRRELNDIYLPTGIGRLRIYDRLGNSCWSYARVHGETSGHPEMISADLYVFDHEGKVVAEIEGFVVKRADREGLQRARQRRLQEWLYEIEWQRKDREPIEAGSTTGSEGQWLVFADRAGTATGLKQRLNEQGQRCITVYAGEHYQNCTNDSYFVNPLKPEDFQLLFRDVLTGSQSVLKGVVHLWSLDCDPEPGGSDSPENNEALSCGSILHLVQSLVKSSFAQAFRLWLVTGGSQSVGEAVGTLNPAHMPLWGLGRVIANEHPELHCTLVDLDPTAVENSVGQLIEEMNRGDREDQIAFREMRRYVARLVHLSSRSRSEVRRLLLPRSESYQLTVRKQGIVDDLEFKSVERMTPGAGQVQIRVHVTGLNFRDVLNVLGMYPGDAGPLGSECVGRITAVGEGVEKFKIGDKVLAVAGGSFSKYVLTPADWTIPKPQGLSDEQAATIPITFLTAYYGLFRLAGMKKGDRVLIHAAAGGVGMAAVQLAQWVGAEVFGTAGSPRKRQFLKSLGVDHVMNSRTLDFADEVMQLTGGRGVDIVLNALTGEFISKSLSVLAPGGKFIEIGKAEIWNAARVAEVNPDVTYAAFDLSEVIAQDSQLVGKMFEHLLPGFQKGLLKPLSLQIFRIEESIGAFRFMAQARHIGKVVVSQKHTLEAGEDESVNMFGSEAAYLITGGLGGLGLKIADWMVEQGARHLVLMGRSEPDTEALKTIDVIRGKGAGVTLARGDVSRWDDVQRVFSGMESDGMPLRGIIHAAGVLDDGVLMQQQWQRFANVLAPKVRGAWLLHHLTRNLQLDFFVLFSSTASVLGAPGQSNYAAANAFMDGLAHFRRSIGLPALSINWGAWGEVGMASLLDHRRMAFKGVGFITQDKGLNILSELLQRSWTGIDKGAIQVVVLPIDWNELFRSTPEIVRMPLFADIIEEQAGEIERRPEPGLTKATLMKTDPKERQGLLEPYLAKQVARELMVRLNELDIRQPLITLGFDSLMAVTVRNRIERDLGITLPVVKFLEGHSVSVLATLLCDWLHASSRDGLSDRKASMSGTPEGTQEITGNLDAEEARSLLERIDELSDDQVNAILEKIASTQLGEEND
jgi:acyl transferase domain-containing protein